MARKFIRRLFAFPIALTTANGNALAANGGQQATTVVGDVNIITVFTHIGLVSTGPFTFQIRPSDLNAGLFNGEVTSETVLSLLDRPGMLPAPIVIKGANSLRMEFTNAFGAIANEVKFTLWGYRDYVAPGDC